MAVAFITGASTGIGLETAILFARRGCRVYAGARRPAGSTGLQRAIDEGLPITPVVLDVDSDESVRAAVARVGSVDVLVNNAGIGSAGAVELMPMAEIRALFETNVFGAVRMMQAVLPAMRERRSGVIVNVTSIMGRITLPCHGHYVATKFALFALSESLAMEMRPLGIRVAIIEPGVVLTPIWGKRAPEMPPMPEYRQGPDRLMRTFESQMEGGLTPDVVAEAIYGAAIGGDDRIRIPVGEDADVWAAARDRSTTEQWVSLYAEPDDTRFAIRAEQMFEVTHWLRRRCMPGGRRQSRRSYDLVTRLRRRPSKADVCRQLSLIIEGKPVAMTAAGARHCLLGASARAVDGGTFPLSRRYTTMLP